MDYAVSSSSSFVSSSLSSYEASSCSVAADRLSDVIMLCKKPYVSAPGRAYPCGQCMPCRFNRRRLWALRIMLEAMTHEASSFLTLTYDAEHLPAGGTLVPRDVQLFIKRLRFVLYPKKIRYYLVGEYGDQSWRPHYHAAIFGIGPDYSELCCKEWGLGFTFLGDLSMHSAQYIAGYVTKKMTSKDDPRLEGKYPEFARMSNRPGIGADAMKSMAAQLDNDFGYKYIDANSDVPTSVVIDGKRRLLGRYLSSKLREYIGFVETGGQKEIIYAKEAELCSMYLDWLSLAENGSKGYKAFLAETNYQSIINFEARDAIYSQRRNKLI